MALSPGCASLTEKQLVCDPFGYVFLIKTSFRFGYFIDLWNYLWVNCIFLHIILQLSGWSVFHGKSKQINYIPYIKTLKTE